MGCWALKCVSRGEGTFNICLMLKIALLNVPVITNKLGTEMAGREGQAAVIAPALSHRSSLGAYES
jgi:hypothetical protein